MAEIMLFAMNMDSCPDTYDTIIMKGLCNGCDHYQGFKVENGFQCIKCSYYADIAKQAKDDES